MKLHHIIAVLKKQLFDTAYNKGVIIKILIYPLLTGLVIVLQPNDNIATKINIVIMMTTMFIGMIPILTITSIINEDKYTNALRMLIMSTVKPLEYLIGIIIYTLFISFVGILIFGIIAGFSGFALFCFITIMLFGTLTTVLMGSAIAIQAKINSIGGNLIFFISLTNVLIPLFGSINPSIMKFSQYWYTSVIQNVIGDLYGNYYGNLLNRLMILLIYTIIFLGIFVFSFSSNKFLNEK